jgi:type II secretory pathway component PulF
MFNNRQTAAFCSQLGSLLTSGLPLLSALAILRDLPQNKKHSADLNRLIDQLNQGLSMSESVKLLLPPLAVGAIGAAERAGDLEASLARLAAYHAEKADQEEKLAGALVYPACVAATSLLSVMVLVVFVLPGLKGVFADLELQLPPATGFVLGASDGLARLWPVFATAIGLAGVLTVKIKRERSVGLEKIIMRTPFLGKLYRQELAIQVCGALGSLLQGGTPILEALRVTGRSIDSPLMRALLQSAGQGVENGGRLSAALPAGNLFPPEALQLIGIGESTGQLDRMLSAVAGFQAKERELALKRNISLLEPALTLGAGLIVGFIVLAMFLPLVNMVSSLQ